VIGVTGFEAVAAGWRSSLGAGFILIALESRRETCMFSSSITRALHRGPDGDHAGGAR
jgi:hypothetical protein